MRAQPCCHMIGKSCQRGADILFSVQVAPEGNAVADGFDLLFLVKEGDRRLVESVCIVVEHPAVLSELRRQKAPVLRSDIADRMDIEFREFFGCGAADEEHLRGRKRP